MNLPPVSQDLEKKYDTIHKKRLALEAEFLRIEKEYKQLVADIMQMKDAAGIEHVQNTIKHITP